MIFERVAPENLPPEVMAAHGPAGTGRQAGRADLGRAGARAARGNRDVDPKGELTDGPFIETKEVLGGIYLLEAATSTTRSRARS